ncbi:MAG TPA: inorganic phosphate transporter [Pseudonocardia sp.]|nr:inorganic phosphate transporter [Pseudonocardia sp.]
MDITFIVLAVVITALLFDFTNGFHDTANAMATSVATGALRPKVAVAISAVLNLVGAFLSTEVAKTISSGLVDETKINPTVIFAGLVGAILWNLATWYFGLPSSSSHALFGGLIGATWVAAGGGAIKFMGIITAVVLPALAAPVVAGLAAMISTYFAYRITAKTRPDQAAKGFKAGQVVSASMVSLAHGTNDAQKTMGIITLTLITAGVLAPNSGPPVWVIGLAGLAIALGTYLGGWRIIRTLGKGLYDMETTQGFAAETSSTATILISSHLGFALSTTQVASGSIFGAGAGKRLADVRWSVAGKMVIAWVLTLPSAAIVGALAGEVAGLGTVGTIIVALVAIAVAAGIYIASRRDPVSANNVNDVPETTRPAVTTAA